MVDGRDGKLCFTNDSQSSSGSLLEHSAGESVRAGGRLCSTDTRCDRKGVCSQTPSTRAVQKDGAPLRAVSVPVEGTSEDEEGAALTWRRGDVHGVSPSILCNHNHVFREATAGVVFRIDCWPKNPTVDVEIFESDFESVGQFQTV